MLVACLTHAAIAGKSLSEQESVGLSLRGASHAGKNTTRFCVLAGIRGMQVKDHTKTFVFTANRGFTLQGRCRSIARSVVFVLQAAFAWLLPAKRMGAETSLKQSLVRSPRAGVFVRKSALTVKRMSARTHLAGSRFGHVGER